MAIADPVADLLLLRVAALLPPEPSLLSLASSLRLSRHLCSFFKNLLCKCSQQELHVGEAVEL